MGGGIGENLLRKGFSLTVFDVSSAAVQRLVGLGAAPAGSPAEVGSHSDILITVVPDGPQVEEVILGGGGALGGAKPGTMFVDCSTIDPTVTAKVRTAVEAKGCRLVDAGMGGSSKEAAEGRLLFMVGATPEDYARVLPVLQAAGANIQHCGGPGAGITVKLVNDLLALSIFVADVEALCLGTKAGVDLEVMMRIFQSTSANNGFLKAAVPEQVLGRNFEPGFKSSLAHKDAGLAQTMAARLGVPLFTLAPARQLYSALLSQGKGDLAIGAVAQLLEDLAGVSLESR